MTSHHDARARDGDAMRRAFEVDAFEGDDDGARRRRARVERGRGRRRGDDDDARGGVLPRFRHRTRGDDGARVGERRAGYLDADDYSRDAKRGGVDGVVRGVFGEQWVAAV